VVVEEQQYGVSLAILLTGGERLEPATKQQATAQCRSAMQLLPTLPLVLLPTAFQLHTREWKQEVLFSATIMIMEKFTTAQLRSCFSMAEPRSKPCNRIGETRAEGRGRSRIFVFFAFWPVVMVMGDKATKQPLALRV
jgi:hypothetical protein